MTVTSTAKPKRTRKAPASTEKPKRKNRTPEQRIEDLKAEIARVEARAAARAAKKDPVLKQTIAAKRALWKALQGAMGDGDDFLVGRLEFAYDTVVEALQSKGVDVAARKAE